VGPDATLSALSMGQVEELLLNASPSQLAHAGALPPDSAPGKVAVATSAPGDYADSARMKLANELVTRAHQQGARIRFIEDPELLADIGGVGAILRFKLQ
jgi:peptide subunit release factor 1 (eRF1)